MLIDAARSFLLVVDIQTNLLGHIAGGDGVVRNTRLLLEAAKVLGIPALLSEQYPKGLGPTVPEVAELFAPGAAMSKTSFACTGDEAMRRAFEAVGRRQPVLVGIESHICVLQTALGFKALGFDPVVVRDAVSSRTSANHAAAIDRLTQAGVAIATTEMVAFEWLTRAGTPEFKHIAKLVK